MAQLNRRCLACSIKYTHCPDCSRADALKPSWASEFCSESCKDLWLTLTRFNMGTHSKDEAKEIISSLDLKPINTYVSCIQRDYAKVMVEEKKPRKPKKIRPVIEVEVIDEPVVEESHEVVLEEKE